MNDIPSLQELERKRFAMIDTARAERLFSKIVTVCKELGQPFDCHYPANMRLRGEYVQGDLRLRFYDTPAPHSFTRLVVRAWVKDAPVCYMVLWNGAPDIDKNTFIVLGQWCETVKELAGQAEGKIDACREIGREKRRKELASMLLLEVTV